MRSSRRPVTTISSGFRQPVESSPASSDSPIFPAPRIAIRRLSTAMDLSLGGYPCSRPPPASRGKRQQAAGEAREQIDAREAGPLAVWREQLLGVGCVCPAAVKGRAELDQAE